MATYDDNCSDITGWTDNDTGSGASTQETFDSRSTFKFTATGPGPGQQAHRNKDIGSISNKFRLTVTTYMDSIGTAASNNNFTINVFTATKSLNLTFCSDGFQVQYVEVGTDLVVQDTWQVWRIDVDMDTATCDVYLDTVLKASGVGCNGGSGTNGNVILYALADTAFTTTGYVDHITIEDLPNVYNLTVTETCTMTDAKALKSTSKSFADSVTLTDIKPLKEITKAFSDAITITDVKPIKEISRTLSESVSLSELTLTREISKTFSESVTLTDTINRILSAFRTFSETVTLTEPKVTKEIQVSKVESVTLTEIVAKALTKSPFVESVELLDTVTKFITLHPFVESCTLTDSNNKTIIKLAFVDSMSITERYIWWAKASEKSTVWSVTTAGTTVWVAVSTATSPWTLAN